MVEIALPECALKGYSDLWINLRVGLQAILGYADATVDPPSPFDTEAWPPPPQSILPPIADLSDPTKAKPRIAWKTYCWGPWRADFYQKLDESFYGEDPSFYLDSGFYNSTVAVVDWRGIEREGDEGLSCIFDDEEDLGTFFAKGTFSVSGLDNDAVRVTIIRFPECAPLSNERPLRLLDPVLCADPECPGDPWCDVEAFPDNPWWDDGTGCRFDLTSFSFHVDISRTTPQEPYAIVVGFEAQIPGHELENGSVVVGTDGVTTFTGTYDGQPASFDYDQTTETVTITFTGDPETVCSVDTTDTLELIDCE